jgi:hypothetical protein
LFTSSRRPSPRRVHHDGGGQETRDQSALRGSDAEREKHGKAIDAIMSSVKPIE